MSYVYEYTVTYRPIRDEGVERSREFTWTATEEYDDQAVLREAKLQLDGNRLATWFKILKVEVVLIHRFPIRTVRGHD